MPTPTALSQITTIAGTGETTIVTAPGSGFTNLILGLIVTTTNNVAGTLTLRESTGGATRGVFDYPNAAAVPGSPLVIQFPAPGLCQPANSNWTLQASANANGIHVAAIYQPL